MDIHQLITWATASDKVSHITSVIFILLSNIVSVCWLFFPRVSGRLCIAAFCVGASQHFMRLYLICAVSDTNKLLIVIK